tara:strand:- start:15100 stop:15276 length:177 start_codon:yes stop_codon:yes gene_type:complete
MLAIFFEEFLILLDEVPLFIGISRFPPTWENKKRGTQLTDFEVLVYPATIREPTPVLT